MHTLLYATSSRGRHLEDLYVEVTRSQTSEVFPIWVHDDKGKMKRGSGLFVGRDGVSVAHHFLKSEEGDTFRFQEGTYKLNVFAKVAGKNAPRLLHSVALNVGTKEAAELQDGRSGLYFDWGPRSQNYIAKIDSKSREVDWNKVMSPIFTPPNPSHSQE